MSVYVEICVSQQFVFRLMLLVVTPCGAVGWYQCFEGMCRVEVSGVILEWVR
jgi:hypothetical protein